MAFLSSNRRRGADVHHGCGKMFIEYGDVGGVNPNQGILRATVEELPVGVEEPTARGDSGGSRFQNGMGFGDPEEPSCCRRRMVDGFACVRRPS